MAINVDLYHHTCGRCCGTGQECGKACGRCHGTRIEACTIRGCTAPREHRW